MELLPVVQENFHFLAKDLLLWVGMQHLLCGAICHPGALSSCSIVDHRAQPHAFPPLARSARPWHGRTLDWQWEGCKDLFPVYCTS